MLALWPTRSRALRLVPWMIVAGALGACAGAGSRARTLDLVAPQGPGAQTGQDGASGAQAELERALRADGMYLDRAAGLLALPATVLVRNDLLEYLLVTRNGAMHESLFLCTVKPSLLNAALLLLGVEPGANARVVETAEKDERGRPLRQVFAPSGDGFFLYVGWREAGETYFFRVEDVVRNLESGRSLRRHRWVFLGSRFAVLKPGQPEAFLADVEGNVINLSYFFQGNTLLTAVPEECLGQTIWAANEWLLPRRGAPVHFFFARAPLERLDPAWVAELPEVKPESAEDGGTEDGGR